MPFGTLWLPVLVAAIAVFLVSSVLHMALRYHKADYKQLPNEDAVREVLQKAAPGPGTYCTPYLSDMKQCKEPAFQEKFKRGPVALINVMPNAAPAMPKMLGLWFLLGLFVSFLAGYVARHALAPGADGLLVWRVVGAIAFGCYGCGAIIDSIWKAQPWGNTARALFDALIYALVTGFVFKWFWPAA